MAVSFFSIFDNVVKCKFCEMCFNVFACDCFFGSVIIPRVRQYGDYRQLNEFRRVRIVGLAKVGFYITNRLKLNKSSIVHCYQVWTRVGQECPVANQLLINAGRPVTLRPVYRRIKAFGLHSYLGVV